MSSQLEQVRHILMNLISTVESNGNGKSRTPIDIDMHARAIKYIFKCDCKECDH